MGRLKLSDGVVSLIKHLPFIRDSRIPEIRATSYQLDLLDLLTLEESGDPYLAIEERPELS
jgi:hypothetical protein